MLDTSEKYRQTVNKEKSKLQTSTANESEFDVSNESPNISEDCQAYELQDDIEFGHWQDTQQGCHIAENGGQLQDTEQGCHNPETSSQQDLPKFTRRGRLIKPPNKLNL